MEDAARTEEMPRRVGHIVLNQSVLPLRMHDSLQVQKILVQRKQETGLAAVGQRSCDRAFEVTPLLGRFCYGECILCVENGIAKQQVQGTMEIGCATFGGDLEARSSGPCEQS